VVSAFPLGVAAFGWVMATVATGTMMLVVVTRTVYSFARPKVSFEATSRQVTWRLRELKVRCRWSSIESDGTGKALVIQTEAGPLRVLLRNRASEQQVRRALEEVETTFASSKGASQSQSGDWPSSFAAALDFLEFEAANTAELRLKGGRLGLPTSLCLVVAAMALSFGVVWIEPPATAAAIIGLAFVGWPFLFRPLRLTVAKGSRSVLVHSWTSESREPLTESMLHIVTVGSPLTSQSFALRISIGGRSFMLPGLTTRRTVAEDARRALLEYSAGICAAAAGGVT
jgi:hypothetical protein